MKIKAILLFFLLLCMTGCDGLGFFGELFGNGDSAETSRTEIHIAEPEPFPITVDGATIRSSPVRIISLSPALSEILFEFGEGERLIGRSTYCDFPRAVSELDVIGCGSGFDADVISAYGADLLLMSSPVSEKDRMKLDLEGIATVVIPAPRSLEEFRGVYRLIGVILYGGFIGEDEGDAAFSGITRACNNPDVIGLGDFIYVTENMAIATGDTLENAVLSCFGNNIAADGTDYVFDRDRLLVKQPDVVLVNSKIGDLRLKEDEFFSQLDAVTQGRIIMLNNLHFERPSARMITLINSMSAQYKDLGVAGT